MNEVSVDAQRMNMIEEVKKRLLSLNSERARMDFEKAEDIQALRAQLREIDDLLVLLKHLLQSQHETVSEVEEEAIEESPVVSESPDIEALLEPDSEIEEEEGESNNEELTEVIEEETRDLGIESDALIHETHEEESDKSIAKSMELQPIEDLKRAISLNERFYYANELFQGDGKEYARAIEEFNHLGSMEDAERLISAKYHEAYHWSQHPEARESFEILLQRRYLQKS